jgi:hypothetical protein
MRRGILTFYSRCYAWRRGTGPCGIGTAARSLNSEAAVPNAQEMPAVPPSGYFAFSIGLDQVFELANF